MCASTGLLQGGSRPRGRPASRHAPHPPEADSSPPIALQAITLRLSEPMRNRFFQPKKPDLCALLLGLCEFSSTLLTAGKAFPTLHPSVAHAADQQIFFRPGTATACTRHCVLPRAEPLTFLPVCCGSPLGASCPRLFWLGRMFSGDVGCSSRSGACGRMVFRG